MQPNSTEGQQTNLLDGSPSDSASILIQENSSGFYEKTNATLALV